MSEINQLILFHPQKFVCRAFEKFGKDQGVKVYTMEQIEEFAYLVEELQPQLVLIHCTFLGQEADFFLAELNKSNFTPLGLVIIGTLSEVNEFAGSIPGAKQLVEPYDLGDLSNILKALLAGH